MPKTLMTVPYRDSFLKALKNPEDAAQYLIAGLEDPAPEYFWWRCGMWLMLTVKLANPGRAPNLIARAFTERILRPLIPLWSVFLRFSTRSDYASLCRLYAQRVSAAAWPNSRSER